MCTSKYILPWGNPQEQRFRHGVNTRVALQSSFPLPSQYLHLATVFEARGIYQLPMNLVQHFDIFFCLFFWMHVGIEPGTEELIDHCLFMFMCNLYFAVWPLVACLNGLAGAQIITFNAVCTVIIHRVNNSPGCSKCIIKYINCKINKMTQHGITQCSYM